MKQELKKEKKEEKHQAVLLKEVVSFLPTEENLVVVDATFGEGGHSQKILEKMGRGSFLLAIDWDAAAQKNFEKLKEKKRASFVLGNFKEIKEILRKQSRGTANFILADLGWRLEQIKNEDYGLTFFSEKSLSMRLDGKKEGLTAEKIVNTFSAEKLADIFRIYGGEKQAWLAAQTILSAREKRLITSAKELAEIIEKSLARFYRRARIHPATKVFQALRIFVNKELENLEIFLEKAVEVLEKGGRLAVITFHSGEDRIVKNFFRANARGCICPPEFPECVCGRRPSLKILTRKPVFPSAKEMNENPRCRSARLRVAEKI